MKPIQAVVVKPQHPGGAVDKPRGLQNAALQHERKAAREAAERSAPAAIVSLSTQQTEPVTYARVHAVDAPSAGSSVHVNSKTDAADASAANAPSAASSVQLGEGSSIHLNSRIDDASGSSTIIVGEGSQVHLNIRAGGTSGHDTLFVGDNAKVHINQRVERDSGSDTIVVGDGASLHLNSRVGTSASSDTLIVPAGTARFIHERAEWSRVQSRDAEPAKLDTRDARAWSAAHFIQMQSHSARAAREADHGVRARRGPERAAVARPAQAQFDSLAYMMHELVEKAPKLNETRDEKQSLHVADGKERGNAGKQPDGVSEQKSAAKATAAAR